MTTTSGKSALEKLLHHTKTRIENHYQLLGQIGTVGDIRYELKRKPRANFPSGTLFLHLTAPYPCVFDGRIIMTLDGVEYQDRINVKLSPATPVAHPIAHIIDLIGDKSLQTDGIQSTVSKLAIHLDCSLTE